MTVAPERDRILEALAHARDQSRAREDRERLSGSLVLFVREAFKEIKRDRPFMHNWHIDAECAHLEAVTNNEIRRLQIWQPPGTMKPVSVEALVLMADGSRKRLGDVEVGDRVVTHTGVPQRVTAVHEQGKLPALRIKTYSGRVVDAAPDHPFLTADGWKPAGHLDLNDVLATVSTPSCDETKDDGRSLEEMRLIGYFIGDGNCTAYYNPNGTIKSSASNITCFDEIQSNDIIRCAEAMGFSIRWSEPGTRWELGGGVKRWLREIGLAGHTSHTKRVPEFVFSLSNEHIAHLLGAYFASDGTLASRSKERRDLTVVFNSVGRELLSDVRHLLLRLGVKSRIREHRSTTGYKGKGHLSYRLAISSLDDAAKFVKRIPVLGEKAVRLKEMGSRRTRFDELLQPDPVETIEEIGLVECRCLTVENDHSFTANDLVVRNSMLVHVFWPVWEWTRVPWLRYWCASHSLKLVWNHCDDARTLLASEWFQARWPEIQLTVSASTGYKNSLGGSRFTTAPKSEGVGQHGDRIIIDDLLDAGDAEATTAAVLNFTNDWYDATVAGRKEIGAAEILIMQRLHENDIAAHALEVGDWHVLCLPERFEKTHPYAWRGDRVHPWVADRLANTPLRHGDPRNDGELLWPTKRDEKASREFEKRLKSFRAAGQLQQRPAAREGEIIKAHWWRFYDQRIAEQEDWKRLPRFGMVVMSVDTPLKDKESNDNVAIQTWGVAGADRYLLDLRLDKMNFPTAKRTVREMAKWARARWRCRHYLLIENAGYGVELIEDLKRELTGVVKIPAGTDGSKTGRAESATDALESGNMFLPGYGPPWQPAYDETKTPAQIAAFVANCALFPNAAHDDDIDAWSQAHNWLRKKTSTPMRTSSAVARKNQVDRRTAAA